MTTRFSRHRRTLAVSAGVAVALVLSACSSSTSGSNSSSSSASSSESSASSSAAPAGSSAPASSGSSASVASSAPSSAASGSASSGSSSSVASSASSGSSAAAVSVPGGLTGTTNYQVTPDPALAGAIPSSITSDGTLEIATDPSSAPYTYVQDGTQNLRGVDIDLGNAVAAKLGLKANWSSIKFTGILAAIQAKRYDFAMSAMGDTPTREKVVDFVDYSTDSNAVVVPKGNPKGVKDITSLCGLKVSDLEGSVFAGLIDAQNAKCSSKMQVSTFQDINQALLQVETGRADATVYQTGIAGYIIKTSPDASKLQVITGTVYGEGYNAIPFNKDNTALRDAVQKAITELMTDGTYAKIYAEWGLSANTIDKITVNDGLRFNQPS